MSVYPKSFSRIVAAAVLSLACFQGPVPAQKRKAPTGGRLAIVVNEHLAALRVAPGLSARLIARLSRGRFVAIIGRRRADEVIFYRVKVSRRKSGWLQSDAVVSPAQAADDQRLMRLIRSAEGFELIAEARIFLEVFPHSSLRPAVLLLSGDAAEEICERLSSEATRRLDKKEMAASEAPEFSYFLNFNALDRYNRQNAHFVFDRKAKQFHYDGAAWREIVRRYPNTPEAGKARERLQTLAVFLPRPTGTR
jgi:hypothetical protein